MEEKKFMKKVKEIIEPAKGPMLDLVSDLSSKTGATGLP